MDEIYLLSGLGADKRVFDYLDLSDYHVRHISWIDPAHNETLENYSERLLKQISAKQPVLIGVSFGGIIATEMAKLIQTKKVILISSARSKSDIPFYYKIIGQMRLNKLIPARFLKITNRLTFWFFGAENKADKALLATIIRETDDRFLKWAIDKIVNWKNESALTNLTTIHGTHDRILPVSRPDFIIENGGHLMIVNRAKELSTIIKKILAV